MSLRRTRKRWRNACRRCRPAPACCAPHTRSPHTTFAVACGRQRAAQAKRRSGWRRRWQRRCRRSSLGRVAGPRPQRERCAACSPAAACHCDALSLPPPPLFQSITSYTQSAGALYSKLLSAAPPPAAQPSESKGASKKKGREKGDAAAGAARTEDLIDVQLEFDRAVKSIAAAVDETAWRWTRHTLLPFVKSSIEAAARSAQQGAPVISYAARRSHKCKLVTLCQVQGAGRPLL